MIMPHTGSHSLTYEILIKNYSKTKVTPNVSKHKNSQESENASLVCETEGSFT